MEANEAESWEGCTRSSHLRQNSYLYYRRDL